MLVSGILRYRYALRAFEVLRGAGSETYEKFIDGHSFLPLFTPFITDGEFLKLKEKINVDLGLTKAGTKCGKHIVMPPDKYRFCGQCVEESFKLGEIAYAQRVHQVSCVEYCPKHGTNLLAASQSNNRNLPLSHGLLFPSNENEWSKLLKPLIPTNDSKAWRALGKWVRILMEGDFPATSPPLRAALFQQRIMEIPRQKGDPASHAARLERHLIRTYGEESLRSLGLPVLDGDTIHWQA